MTKLILKLYLNDNGLIRLCLPQLYKHVVQIVEKFIKKVRQTHLNSFIR